MTLRVTTPYGDSYDILENGNIIRNDITNFYPSGQWKMLGISHVKRNCFIPLRDITPQLLLTLPLLYKNGHPQWTIRDLDHGTIREWGNTTSHGIRYIYFIKKGDN